MERRSKGDDAFYFDHQGTTCTDASRHRACKGRWRGEIQVGYDGSGKRLRRKVSGQTRAAVQDKIRELHREIDAGRTKAAPSNYTVRRAAEDWLASGLSGRAPKTIRKNKDVLEPLLRVIGSRRLRELDADEIHDALQHMAATYSTAVIRMGHNALTRAIRYAMARRLVGVNVAELIDTPPGQPGRPSRAFTAGQVAALLTASEGTRMHAYIALCVGTSIRTEEARALHWDAVSLDGDPDAVPPVPPHVQVWRSVRARGDTKTTRSRRTLGMPQITVGALKAHQARPDGQHPLVFATRDGHQLDAANVRREFRAVVKNAGIPGNWTPRELRHTGVSLLSLGGVPIEEIARIAGHATTRTTEIVYRHELRPVITTGATALDTLLNQTG
jgi:integrase